MSVKLTIVVLAQDGWQVVSSPCGSSVQLVVPTWRRLVSICLGIGIVSVSIEAVLQSGT